LDLQSESCKNNKEVRIIKNNNLLSLAR